MKVLIGIGRDVGLGEAAVEIVRPGDWAKAGGGCSSFQPSHLPSSLHMTPQHQSQGFQSGQISFPSGTDWQSPRWNLFFWLYSWRLKAFSSSAQREASSGELGKWETVGRSLRRVTCSLIFLQDRRTQETVICQTLQQNKTGLLLIQTKAHSCRKVSTRNLSPPWSFCRFVITFPGFFFPVSVSSH